MELRQTNGLGDRLQQTANSTTTTYAVDMAGGLTQVLSDGMNTYLYGVDRINQQHNSLTEYYLADTLGSVRQLTNSTGEVVLARAYDPYGNLVENNAYNGITTAYSYAGEYNDYYIKLIYLRSRYYSPTTGRFLTKDSWQGDYTKPLSLNGWNYVYNNPLKFVDPSGNVPLINQYDLTNWFYEELRFNVNHVYTNQIYALLSSVGSASPADKFRAVMGWIYLVKDKAKWDFKHNIEYKLGQQKSIILQHYGGYDWYEYSMPGNIFYGYIGRAAGFSKELLHMGAAYAEITDPAHAERDEACCPEICQKLSTGYGLTPSNISTYRTCLQLGCYYFNPEWKDTYFDDPLDYQAVEFGVKLFDNFNKNITFTGFESFLSNNRSMLLKGNPVSETKWDNIDDDFYQPGYFDGPDTAKNAPIVNALLLWPPLAND